MIRIHQSKQTEADHAGMQVTERVSKGENKNKKIQSGDVRNRYSVGEINRVKMGAVVAHQSDDPVAEDRMDPHGFNLPFPTEGKLLAREWGREEERERERKKGRKRKGKKEEGVNRLKAPPNGSWAQSLINSLLEQQHQYY